MRLRRRVLAAWTSALLPALSACGSGGDASEQSVTFQSDTIAIVTGADTFHMQVELARDSTEQAYGLMDRTKLDPEHGMLFLYDAVQDTTQGFWMFRTKIPLDVAFIDSAGTVVAIRSMAPCTSPQPAWCNPYLPGQRWQSAIEANQGFFARHGIAPGATVHRRP